MSFFEDGKFCKDCLHAKLTDEWRCYHPVYEGFVDRVTGSGLPCHEIRHRNSTTWDVHGKKQICGADGLFWEERKKRNPREIPETLTYVCGY